MPLVFHRPHQLQGGWREPTSSKAFSRPSASVLPKWLLLKVGRFWTGSPGTVEQWSLLLHGRKYISPPPAFARVCDLAVLSRREAGKAHFEIVASIWADWIQFWIQMSRTGSLGFCSLLTEARCDAPLKDVLIMMPRREQGARGSRLSRRKDDLPEDAWEDFLEGLCQAPTCTLGPGQESESCSSSSLATDMLCGPFPQLSLDLPGS